MMGRRPRRLSTEFIRRVDCPGRYGDGRGGFGLSLLVQLSGRGLVKSWTQRVVARDGRPTSLGLGGYPAVALAEARRAAAANAIAIKSGKDVLAERERSSGSTGLTFAQAAERAIESLSPHWKGSKTAAVWHAMLTSHVYPSIGEMQVARVSPADMYGVLAPLWCSRRPTAIKIRTVINAVYAWAAAQGMAASNPALAVNAALPKGGAKAGHFRALPWQDIPAALARVEASGARAAVKGVVRFAALTAARSGEARGATWEEIDLDAATWTLSAERTKSGRAWRVPLSEAALAVLGQACARTGGVGLVFPGMGGAVIGDSTLGQLFRKLGIEGTPHGLRSGFRSWAAEHDVDHGVAEFCLAHVEGSSTVAAYQRSDLLERRRPIMERWAETIG